MELRKLTIFNSEIWVIPNSFTDEEVDDILFALDLWTEPAPGYDGPDDWMIAQYPLFRDVRAVEETLAMARAEGVAKMEYSLLIPEISINNMGDKVHWKTETVMSYLESMQGAWEVALQTANGQLDAAVKEEAAE